MLMTEIQTNRASVIAAEKEMPFNVFAGRCLLRGLSYDTARNIWFNEPRARGWNITTKQIVSKVLREPVEVVFPD